MLHRGGMSRIFDIIFDNNTDQRYRETISGDGEI